MVSVLIITRMGSSLLITLREGLEISLVLAIIAGYLKKTDRSDRIPTMWLGAGIAAVTCLIFGFAFDRVIGEFTGKWEQFIEGTIALTAAAVLTWMIFWMRGHARGIESDLQQKIDSAIERSPWALVLVAFVAVAREGFETVLFLLGAAGSGESGGSLLLGGFIGLALSAVLGFAFYLGSERIDLRSFFKWTGLLLILFAAGLFAKGIHEFREFFELEASWYSAPLWNISSGPLATGWTMDFLKGLFGWSPNPERIRVAAYFAFLIPALWFFYREPPQRSATVKLDEPAVHAGTAQQD